MFNEEFSTERMIKTAKFIEKTEIEKNIYINPLIHSVPEWSDTR